MVVFLIIMMSMIILLIALAMVFTTLTMGIAFWLGCVQCIAFIIIFWLMKEQNKWY